MKKSSNKKDNTLPRDGVKSLVTNFGGPKEFIKKVIEDCYFFDKSIMEKQFDFIKDNLNLCLSYGKGNLILENPDKAYNLTNKSILRARKSQTPATYKKYQGRLKESLYNQYGPFVIKISIESEKRKNKWCLIYKDDNGNKYVTDLIKENTGLILSSAKKDLTNYIISHIWGNATDPRYFSNFWNIVLVPNYANPLLDKNYEDNLEHDGNYLLESIKQILAKIYHFDQLDWQSIFMNSPEYDENIPLQEEEIFINVLCEKNSKKEIIIKRYNLMDYILGKEEYYIYKNFKKI